jgi:hypothetical protein
VAENILSFVLIAFSVLTFFLFFNRKKKKDHLLVVFFFSHSRKQMSNGNQSDETRRLMKRLYNTLDDSRRPLIRQGINDFARNMKMTNENRRKLHGMVDIVSAAEFKSAIQQCIEWFLRTFADFRAREGRSPAFAIGRFASEKQRKSSDWLEHKVVEALGYPMFYIDDRERISASSRHSNQPKNFGAFLSRLDVVVLLDDGVYSGEQLETWVHKFNSYWRRKRHIKSALLIAAGYATVEGAQRVRRNLIGNYDEFFHAKTIHTNATRPNHAKHAIKALMNTYELTQTGPTLTVMPHKSPNGLSMGFYHYGGSSITADPFLPPHLSVSIRKRTGYGGIYQDIDELDDDGYTMLMVAAKNGKSDLVRGLLHKGSDVEVVNFDGETALMKAAYFGHLDIVRELVHAGSDVNVRNVVGETALTKAARAGHTEIVRFLLSRRADPNSPISSWTSSHPPRWSSSLESSSGSRPENGHWRKRSDDGAALPIAHGSRRRIDA